MLKDIPNKNYITFKIRNTLNILRCKDINNKNLIYKYFFITIYIYI